MENNNIKEISIDDQIRNLKKVLQHENNLIRMHNKKYLALWRELLSLREQRILLFPEQYTKYGILRKQYRNGF